MAKKKKHPDDASATSKNSRGTVKTVGTVDSENLSDEKLAMLAGLPQKEARSDEESESGNSDSEAGDEEVSMLQDEDSMTLGTLGSEGVHVDDSLTLDGGDSLSLGSSGKSPGNKKKRGTMAIDTAANPTSPKKGGIMSIFGKGPKVFDKLPSPSIPSELRLTQKWDFALKTFAIRCERRLLLCFLHVAAALPLLASCCCMLPVALAYRFFPLSLQRLREGSRLA